jgi:hypothetical protein
MAATKIARRAALAVALFGATFGVGARAADPQVIHGVFALAGQTPRSSAAMRVTPLGNGSEGLADGLEFAFHAADQSPLSHFHTELTKQLHVIAISDDFRLFQHDHVDAPGPNGHFRLKLNFPHPGLYHIYADAVPEGLGHQVFRFDLPVGVAANTFVAPALKPSGLDEKSGAYTVKIDPVKLVAGQEAHIVLHIGKNGQPATDITPYLGMPAHAVFIENDSLSYTHAHAGPIAAGHAAAEHAMGEGKPVSADLGLAVTLPTHGMYKMWLQFMAGGQPHTVAFIVPVT